MKRVSSKIANYIAKFGYWDYRRRCLIDSFVCGEIILDLDGSLTRVEHPFILDVWLWLWREKHVKIVCGTEYMTSWHGDSIVPLHGAHTKDPEESIGKEIEYLFDNNMIELTNG